MPSSLNLIESLAQDRHAERYHGVARRAAMARARPGARTLKCADARDARAVAPAGCSSASGCA